MIYLDNAATTLPKPPSVTAAVNRALLTMSSPGRGVYAPAMRASNVLLDCRIAAAELFHVPEPEQVIFTFNATHALNLAIRTLAEPDSHVLISGFEHNAVTRPLHALGCKVRIAGRRLFDPADTLSAFREAIDWASLVVCTQVSNVFGYILPIAEIALLCHEKNIPLILDCSQSAGMIDLDFASLGADFAAMPGHKGLLGPQGTGLLLCKDSAMPLLYGGTGSDSLSQNMPPYLPDRLEAGTHNMPGVAGLLAGIRAVQSRGISRILAHEQHLLSIMLDRLKAEPRLELFSDGGSNQSGVLSLRCRGLDSETLAAALGERGICVRGGLHCAPCAHESAETAPDGTVRFSPSPFTTEEQILTASDTLLRIVHSKSDKMIL